MVNKATKEPLNKIDEALEQMSKGLPKVEATEDWVRKNWGKIMGEIQKLSPDAKMSIFNKLNVNLINLNSPSIAKYTGEEKAEEPLKKDEALNQDDNSVKSETSQFAKEMNSSHHKEEANHQKISAGGPPPNSSKTETVPTKKYGKSAIFCHYHNNNKSCLAGATGCTFRHEKSKKCKQAYNCKRYLCQFRHISAEKNEVRENSRPINSMPVRSLGARIIKEEDQNSPENAAGEDSISKERDIEDNCHKQPIYFSGRPSIEPWRARSLGAGIIKKVNQNLPENVAGEDSLPKEGDHPDKNCHKHPIAISGHPTTKIQQVPASPKKANDDKGCLASNYSKDSMESDSECSDDEITLDKFMEEYSETEDSDYIPEDESKEDEDSLKYDSGDDGLSVEELNLGDFPMLSKLCGRDISSLQEASSPFNTAQEKLDYMIQCVATICAGGNIDNAAALALAASMEQTQAIYRRMDNLALRLSLNMSAPEIPQHPGKGGDKKRYIILFIDARLTSAIKDGVPINLMKITTISCQLLAISCQLLAQIIAQVRKLTV
jgi:hypothetical protein